MSNQNDKFTSNCNRLSIDFNNINTTNKSFKKFAEEAKEIDVFMDCDQLYQYT